MAQYDIFWASIFLFVTLEVYISCTDNAWNVHVSSETRGRPAALSVVQHCSSSRDPVLN